MFPVETLRILLALIAVGSAWMAGRTRAAMSAGRVRQARHLAWMFRSAVCLAVLTFRHDPDLVLLAAAVMAVIAFAGGWWQMKHAKPPEDLSQAIVPHDRDAEES